MGISRYATAVGNSSRQRYKHQVGQLLLAKEKHFTAPFSGHPTYGFRRYLMAVRRRFIGFLCYFHKVTSLAIGHRWKPFFVEKLDFSEFWNLL